MVAAGADTYWGVLMYRFEARLYQFAEYASCYGELYEEPPLSSQPVMTAHTMHADLGFPTPIGHTEIIRCVEAVCREIAQNLDDSLF